MATGGESGVGAAGARSNGTHSRRLLRGRFFTISLWVLVFALAIAVSYALWKSAGKLEFEEPGVHARLQDILSDVRRLDESYGNAIRNQREFRDLWNLVALVVGAAAAAAGVLRAPQGLIVMLGAFGAVIFGAIQLYSPQAVITALSTARGKLACIESKARLIDSARRSSLDSVPGVRDELDAVLHPLEEQAAPLDVYYQRLQSIWEFRAKEREAAMSEIDLALATPAVDSAEGISALKSRRRDILHVEELIASIRGTGAKRFPESLRTDLENARIDIDVTIETLRRPKVLEKQLSDESEAYLAQLATTESTDAEAKRTAGKTHFLLEEIPTAIERLTEWPKELESAVATARTSVASVHNELMRSLAQSGTSPQDLKGIIATATQTVAGIPGVDVVRVEPSGQLVTAGRGEISTVVPLLTIDELIAMAKETLDKSNAELKRLAAQIQMAKRDIERMRPVVDDHLPVLVGVRSLLSIATNDVDMAIGNLSTTLSEADGAFARASKILDLVDFPSLEAEIRACASAVLVGAAPTTGAEPEDERPQAD